MYEPYQIRFCSTPEATGRQTPHLTIVTLSGLQNLPCIFLAISSLQNEELTQEVKSTVTPWLQGRMLLANIHVAS